MRLGAGTAALFGRYRNGTVHESCRHAGRNYSFGRYGIQSIIRQLAERGIGVLITDHNVRETLGICDRAHVLGEGEILADGKPQQILENKMVRKIYLGDDFKL